MLIFMLDRQKHVKIKNENKNFIVPHTGTIVIREILIIVFFAHKHVLRPQEAKKPV